MRAEGTKRVENLLLKKGVKKNSGFTKYFFNLCFSKPQGKNSHSEINAEYIFNNFIKTLNCLT